MDCNVVRDLMPLCIDACCSEKSKIIVTEHIESCPSCKKLFEELKTPADTAPVSETPLTMSRLKAWKASVMQSLLLFVSFAMITVGVALEAKTPSGAMNGFWAVNLVIPATGFMLSLANWYFVRLYKSKKTFSVFSSLATLGITLSAYVWAAFHYNFKLLALFARSNSAAFADTLQAVVFHYGIGLVLTAAFCILSRLLSSRYAKMLGKE